MPSSPASWLAGWLVSLQPSSPPTSTILGLICLAVQVQKASHPGRILASVEDPQTVQISRLNAIPGASGGWWAAASRPGEPRPLLATVYFRLFTKARKFRRYETTPLRLCVIPSGKDSVRVFPFQRCSVGRRMHHILPSLLF